MASITNPFQSSFQTSRFSSLYLSPNRATTCHLVLKTRSLTSKATRLAFSPLPESREPPTSVEFSGKTLRFSGWSQLLRRRGSVEFPVVAATAADADGSKSSLSCFFISELVRSVWVLRKWSKRNFKKIFSCLFLSTCNFSVTKRDLF